MPELLVLQHADWEQPGYYGDLLAERGVAVHVARPNLGEPLPDWRRFDAVLAMGGPMSVNDAGRLPWLAAELVLVRDVVKAGRPFFGACLGAQLLAAALGARVYPGPRPEFGLHPVSTTPDTADDPVLGVLPARTEVFQWHGETFGLPTGAVSLASSSGYPHQAIRFGDLAYGLQFHLEVSPDLLAKWLAVPACLDEARAALGPDAEQRLTRELCRVEAVMADLARQVFSAWLDLATR
jgi:GMP synthase (glutamine-hydrolysing)